MGERTKDNEQCFTETKGSKLRNILTPYILFFQLKQGKFLEDETITNKQGFKDLLSNTQTTCEEHLTELIVLMDNIMKSVKNDESLTNERYDAHYELDGLIRNVVAYFYMLDVMYDFSNTKKFNEILEDLEGNCMLYCPRIKKLSQSVI